MSEVVDNYDHDAVHLDHPTEGDLCHADIGDEQTCLHPIVWVGPGQDTWVHVSETVFPDV